MTRQPWDTRLATWLVRPLVATPVHPNALTAVRLLVGLAGAALFATGENMNGAAALIVLSNFLDHTDGALARLSGKTSRFGHRFDLLSDALVTVGLFVGLGIGLAASLGPAAPLYGVVAGTAVAGIFQVRHVIEERYGKQATRQANFAGFETEDVLYLLPLVTVFGVEAPFLMLAAVGAPVGLGVVTWQFRAAKRGHGTP